MNNTDIDKMPVGPELDALIETEIYGSIPLTDAELDLVKAAFAMSSPHKMGEVRMYRIALKEPGYETGLMFRLSYQRVFSIDTFGNGTQYLINTMREMGWLFESMDTGDDGEGKPLCAARFKKQRKARKEEMAQAYRGMVLIEGEGLAKTDAHAVCIAALNAVRALKALEDKS